MTNIEKLKKIVKTLHKINFDEKEGIIHPDGGGSGYQFQHKCGKNFVHKFDKCDKNDLACTVCDKYDLAEGTRFTFVAHGTHTLDFIEAHKYVNGKIIPSIEQSELESWSTKPVMFVLENPSNGKKNNYFGTKHPENKRFPTESWYWLSSDYDVPADKYIYPFGFAPEWYGGMMFSIMKTFNIANGYVTDFVKCGIGSLNKTLSTKDYDKQIIQTCMGRYFQQELEALRGGDEKQAVIIIAFGDNAYENVKNNLNKVDILVKVPHPSPLFKTKDERAQYGRRVFTAVANVLLENHFYDGVNAVDPVSILVKEKQNTLTFDIIQQLIQDVFVDYEYEYNTQHKENYVTWYLSDLQPDNSLLIDIWLHKPPQKILIDDDEYPVLWVEYDLINNKTSKFWRYKSKNDKGYVDIEVYEKFGLYKMVMQLQEKIKRLTETI